MPSEATSTPSIQLTLPESFADLRIENKHSKHEFSLHLPLLAIYGIGSHPLVEYIPGSIFGTPSVPPSDAILTERLNKLKTLLATSELPTEVLQAVFAEVYDTSPAAKPKTASLTPPSLDVSKCFSTLEEILSVEEIGLTMTPFIEHWCEAYLKKASQEEAIAILHRIFFASSVETIEKTLLTSLPKSVIQDKKLVAYYSIVNHVLERVRESIDKFDEIVTFLEEVDDHVIGLRKVLLLTRLVYGDNMKRVDPSSAPQSSSITTSLQAKVKPQHAFTLRWESMPTAEMAQTLQNRAGISPSEFAIGIDGNDSKFLIVQGTKMFWHWEYFRRMAATNLAEMRTRVIVLPSHFPVGVLVVIMKIVHQSIWKEVQDLIDALSKPDLEFVNSHGIEFGLCRPGDGQNPPLPHQLFASLYRRAQSQTVVPLQVDTARCIEQLQNAHLRGLLGDADTALSHAVLHWPEVAEKCRSQFDALDLALVKLLFKRLKDTAAKPASTPTVPIVMPRPTSEPSQPAQSGPGRFRAPRFTATPTSPASSSTTQVSSSPSSSPAPSAKPSSSWASPKNTSWSSSSALPSSSASPSSLSTPSTASDKPAPTNSWTRHPRWDNNSSMARPPASSSPSSSSPASSSPQGSNPFSSRYEPPAQPPKRSNLFNPPPAPQPAQDAEMMDVTPQALFQAHPPQQLGQAALGQPTSAFSSTAAPFWAPTRRLSEPVGNAFGAQATNLLSSISERPYYESFSFEQIRWLNQTLPRLFPATVTLSQSGIKLSDEVAHASLSDAPEVKSAIRPNSVESASLWLTANKRAYANGFHFKPAALIQITPTPLAQPPTTSSLLSNLSFLLSPSAPSQFADLRIINKPSNHEFVLHTGVLAAHGIGIHPRIQRMREDDVEFEKQNGLFKRSSQHTPLTGLADTEEAKEKLENFQSLLETSDEPVAVLERLVRLLYNDFMPTLDTSPGSSLIGGDERLIEKDPSSTAFSLTECFDYLRSMLLLEPLHLNTQAAMLHWRNRVLQRATRDEAVQFLIRVFRDCVSESNKQALAKDTSEPSTVEIDPTLRFALSSIFEQILGPTTTADDFFKTLSHSGEDATEAESILKMLSTHDKLNTSGSVIAGMFKTLIRPQASIEWLSSANDPSSSTTPTSSNGDALDSSSHVIDMVDEGQKFLSKYGANDHEFAIGIDGNGSNYMMVQGWLLNVHWPYFEMLRRSNMNEMRSRVIVLPSHFPVKVLEVVMKLVHGHDMQAIQNDISTLCRDDLMFVLSFGSEFCLFRDWTEVPSPYNLFNDLYIRSRVLLSPLSLQNCLEQMYVCEHLGDAAGYDAALRYVSSHWMSAMPFGKQFVKLFSHENFCSLIERIFQPSDEIPSRTLFQDTTSIPVVDPITLKGGIKAPKVTSGAKILFVKNLPIAENVNASSIFARFGTVTDSRFWNAPKRDQGMAFIEFEDENAVNAKSLSDLEISGVKLDICILNLKREANNDLSTLRR